MYASTEAFIEDAKWILHNSMIYNGATSKYTADAKMIIKICKHEVSKSFRTNILFNFPQNWFCFYRDRRETDFLRALDV